MIHPEVGRELRVDELVAKTVVIISREGSTFGAYTVWVDLVGSDFVAFLAGAIKTTLLVRRHADGKLTDDTGQQVRVWEYLGEV